MMSRKMKQTGTTAASTSTPTSTKMLCGVGVVIKESRRHISDGSLIGTRQASQMRPHRDSTHVGDVVMTRNGTILTVAAVFLELPIF